MWYLLSFSPPWAFCSAKYTYAFPHFLVFLRYAALLFYSFVLPPSLGGTHAFPPCSLLSALLFPCINCYPELQRLYRFVLKGQKCRVCSPTGSLSQQHHKTRFQQIPLKPHNIFITSWQNTCRMNLEWKLQHRKYPGSLSRFAYFVFSVYSDILYIVFAGLCDFPRRYVRTLLAGTLWSMWECDQAVVDIMLPQSDSAAVLWNKQGASVITSIINATQHSGTETRTTWKDWKMGNIKSNLQFVHGSRMGTCEGVIERSSVVRGNKM